MDKNIIKETMLSLERPVGESPMSVLRRLRMRPACWLPMHCLSSKLHFTRGIRAAAASLEPSGSTTGRTLQSIGQRRNASSLGIRSKKTAPRVIGAMTRTMRRFTLHWTNCEHGVRTRLAQNRWDGRLSLRRC